MIGLHPFTISFLIVAIISIAACVFVAFRPDRNGATVLPDLESLIDPEYRDLDIARLLQKLKHPQSG